MHGPFASLALGALLSLGVTSVSGCASIVHSGPRHIPLDSTPSGANVAIVDAEGNTIAEDRTPFLATLNPKGGFFKGARYRLRVSADGHEPHEVNIVPTMSGWYVANVLFGGLIGLLVVDPLTGAMWNLKPEDVEQALEGGAAGVVEDGEGFIVVLSSELTDAERAATTPIETSPGQ